MGDPNQVTVDPLNSALKPIRTALASVATQLFNPAQQSGTPAGSVNQQLYNRTPGSGSVQNTPAPSQGSGASSGGKDGIMKAVAAAGAVGGAASPAPSTSGPNPSVAPPNFQAPQSAPPKAPISTQPANVATSPAPAPAASSPTATPLSPTTAMNTSDGSKQNAGDWAQQMVDAFNRNSGTPGSPDEAAFKSAVARGYVTNDASGYLAYRGTPAIQQLVSGNTPAPVDPNTYSTPDAQGNSVAIAGPTLNANIATQAANGGATGGKIDPSTSGVQNFMAPVASTTNSIGSSVSPPGVTQPSKTDPTQVSVQPFVAPVTAAAPAAPTAPVTTSNPAGTPTFTATAPVAAPAQDGKSYATRLSTVPPGYSEDPTSQNQGYIMVPVWGPNGLLYKKGA